MKKMPYDFLKGMWMLIPLLLITIFISCGDDEEEPNPMVDAPIASFQFTVDANNFLQVTFSNFSQNASTYSWNFGDGNTSTEKDPVYTYAAAGSYTVTLTATNSAGDDNMKSETVTLTDPMAAQTALDGGSSKTWYLLREGVALGIGPGANNNEWWSFGGATPLGDRPCILDDNFTFHRDGTFEFNSNGTIFIDSNGNGGWHESEDCWDETDGDVWGDNPDRAAFASGGDYTFDFDNTAGTLTINGLGAYIGLPNKTAGGDNPDPIDVKTYSVFNLVEGDVADSLGVSLVGDGFAWNFYLVSYENISDLPEIPGALPSASFTFEKDGFSITCNNTSINATSYMWDFGDGGMSSEENPTYTYGNEGEYTITLTAMDNMGNSAMATMDVVISAAVFSPSTLSVAEGKTWVLDGANSYFVGPGQGDGTWWGGPGQEDVDGVRACQFDDEWTFYDDGRMDYDSKGMVYAEAYMGGMDNPGICLEDANIPAPFNVLGSGSHMFTTTDATEMAQATITAMGAGAFIGFNKGINGGELNGMDAPPSSITYDVFDYSITDGVERVTITVDIAGDRTAFWTIRLRAVE
ncbi:MAG: PKD domain-containing protein [Saprospiraceae bacterium]|nr:PKD domain-containing protein [Saprospiraceae bacterium]